MSEQDKAELDALLFGRGFMFEGRRVKPEDVLAIEYGENANAIIRQDEVYKSVTKLDIFQPNAAHVFIDVDLPRGLHLQQIGRSLRPVGHWNSQKRRWRRQCRKLAVAQYGIQPTNKRKHSRGWRRHVRRMKAK